MAVTDLCRVPFSIGKHNASKVVCDVIDMDVCHIILGCPWQFDVGATNDCKANTYTFDWKGKTICLLPNNQGIDYTTDKNKTLMLVISSNQLLHAWRDASHILALIVKEKTIVSDHQIVLEPVKALIQQFSDIGSENLPPELPPLRSIQHQIDLIHGATLPNLSHYNLSLIEHQIPQHIVDELLEK
ncbi:uncharacterized protein LOC110092337 [Dendrobium catenatum]|uniref:uncharacterized protein LOC110092337 n=1 Tax=Dendrobium catenatum TaxID=906689 RepID=UPI0009F57D72|nr:uncharacterized protein LOC110092337 [Dendrobium catenatum]